MEYHKTDQTLFVKLKSDLTYPSAKKLETLVNVEDIESLVIDLTEAKIVDSEGIRFIYTVMKEGVQITLVNPPYIFDKIVDILKLKSYMKDLKIVREERR